MADFVSVKPPFALPATIDDQGSELEIVTEPDQITSVGGSSVQLTVTHSVPSVVRSSNMMPTRVGIYALQTPSPLVLPVVQHTTDAEASTSLSIGAYRDVT